MPQFPAREVRVSPSDALVAESHDVSLCGTTNPTVSGTTTLAKQIVIEADGTYRIQFSLRRSAGSGTANGQIARLRGATRVGVGVVRGSTSPSASSFTQDIPGWKRGDILELHLSNQDQNTNNTEGSNLIVMGSFREVEPAAPGGKILKATIS